jgi:hypothetical protein
MKPSITYKILIQVLLGFSVIALSQSVMAKETFHLCYFSQNNPKEFETMKTIMDQANQYSDAEIVVKEFFNPDTEANPEKAFINMIESGVRCDALVISGHHTGGFAGERSAGKLTPAFLEKLSCSPKYMDWFYRIQSVWLQGCRTLGVESNAMGDQTADFHTERVGNVRELDGLEQNMSELDEEFTQTLDLDNPLSSRYMRIFPKSMIFGWTATAPGIEAKSERSLPAHLVNTINRLPALGKVFNPFGTMTVENLKSLANTLKLFLTSGSQSHEIQEGLAKGWIDHARNPVQKIGFTPPIKDINAYLSLYRSNNENLIQAKQIACNLINSQDTDQVLALLDQIIADEQMMHYTFHAIEALLRNESSVVDKNSVKQKLNTPEFHSFLQRKLKLKTVGLLSKIKYYSMLKEASNGQKYPEIAAQIKTGITAWMNSDKNKTFNRDRLDYSITMVETIFSYDFMSFEDFIGLAKNKPEYLYFLTTSITKSYWFWTQMAWVPRDDLEVKNSEEMSLKIIKHPLTDDDTLSELAYFMTPKKGKITDVEGFLRIILNHPNARASSLSRIVEAIGCRSDVISPEVAEELIRIIIEHPSAGETPNNPLSQIIGVLSNKRCDLKNAEELLRLTKQKKMKFFGHE